MGLPPSPGGTLATNTDGYVDYLDINGCVLGGGATPPAGTVFIRRWSVEPLPTNPNNTLILQVLVTRRAIGGPRPGRPSRVCPTKRGSSASRRGRPNDVARSSRCAPEGDAGFSLIEMMVSTAIMVVVMGSVFSLMNPAQGTFQAQPEVSDMQQRLRVAVETLQQDLVMAGAGTYQGAKIGTLVNYFSPILPHRVGTSCPARADNPHPQAITIMYVPPTTAQTTIRDDMPTRRPRSK